MATHGGHATTPRGRRWLAGSVGKKRSFRTRQPDGEVIEWSETYAPAPWREPTTATVFTSGTGHLRIRGWQFTREWVSALDAAFDWFLTLSTTLGTIRFSIGGGRLADPEPIVGEPPESGASWRKPVRFLIDRQACSASEDAILGLGQLPNVQIVGEPSGGGSGRPRSIQLAPDVSATISTALTFAPTGHCVEAHGVPVDLALPIDACFRDPAAHPASVILGMADRVW